MNMIFSHFSQKLVKIFGIHTKIRVCWVKFGKIDMLWLYAVFNQNKLKNKFENSDYCWKPISVRWKNDISSTPKLKDTSVNYCCCNIIIYYWKTEYLYGKKNHIENNHVGLLKHIEINNDAHRISTTHAYTISAITFQSSITS